MSGSNPDVGWRPLGDAGDHYWLVQRMAKACGVDPATAAESGVLEQTDWVRMVQTCRTCRWTEGCERWLNRVDAAENNAPPPDCLNATALKKLAGEAAK